MPRAMLVNTDEVLQAADELGDAVLIEKLSKMRRIEPPSALLGIAPVRKTKRSMSHVSYADDLGTMEMHGYTEWLCPICDWFVGAHRSTPINEKKKPCNFCTRCGQRIDWSGVELDDTYDAPVPVPES